MPSLSGIHSYVPFDEPYVRLGEEPGSPEAQLVLLAVAGEAGYQRLAVTTALLASHLALPETTVDTAIDTLISAQWFAAEALGDGGRDRTTVVAVASPATARVFRPVFSALTH